MSKGFNPGGQKGKLHRELNIPVGQKISQARLAQAERSKNPEIKRDAIRAKTMEGWNHLGGKPRHPDAPPRGIPTDHGNR